MAKRSRAVGRLGIGGLVALLLLGNAWSVRAEAGLPQEGGPRAEEASWAEEPGDGATAEPGDGGLAEPGDGAIVLAPVDVVTARPLAAASQRTVRDRDFLLLPRQTASDLLLNVPHLHISQHSGGGKGHQIFLRGFDAEHGEDVAIYLEGVPLNLPSHIHGIGYVDLHFLIPEAVARIDLIKGPYDVRYGDFATAGALDFELRSHFDQWQSATTYGRFNTFSQRVHLGTGRSGPVYAAASAEYFRTDGFTDFGGWQGGRFLGKVGTRVGKNDLFLLLGAYRSAWDAADTIPQAAVDSGRIGFYGGIDDSDGGEAHRYHLSAHLTRRAADWRLRTLAYVVHSRALIYSNYTYFLKSPDHGDQTEQGDERVYFGARADAVRVLRTGPAEWTLRAGGEYRGDIADITQWRTEDRARWDRVTQYDGTIHAAGLYLNAEVRPVRWFRAVAGGRYDHFFFDLAGVEDLVRPSGYVDQELPLEGTADAGIFSPKAALIFSPSGQWDLFVNYGRGFHSPDIRDKVRNPGAVIPDAHIGELSTRVRIGRRFDIAGGVWAGYVADELFFDPDLGRSVGQGASRRLGGELETRWAPWDPVLLYADVSYTDARLVAEESPVVGSPRWMVTSGAALRDLHGFRGNLRVRYIGSRPLDKGRLSSAETVVDLLAGWEHRWVALDLTVENLLNHQWKDSQFYYVSRYRPDIEALAPGYHFTPGTPLAIKGTVTLKW
jgi:outer membrane receptor protein involved in Fe transport